MLKSLELLGFKSFADRTVFEFSRGVTCVVGPNGSGKSNVVDAIKWILGDQSPKSLRGKEMADVIFNGSASRRPSNYAEATLTFDNSAGFLPIASREVQIGRRLYRSGDSEYLLNRNAVRLKDVRDIFLGSGAGTAAYSIIEQGRVDQLLQASPLTRRVVFEEAAGISRYKAKRVEAQRRLERVSQNLERLTDIVDELDAQLTSTRSQASKAAKYRELSLELKQLWTGLAADSYRYLKGKLAAARRATDELQSRYRSLTAECDQLVTQKQEVEEQGHDAEDRQRGLERRQSEHRQEIVSATSSIEHQREREVEYGERLNQLRDSRLQLMRQLDAVGRELIETCARLRESQAACQAKREEANQRRDLLSRHASYVKDCRGRLAEMQQRYGNEEQALAEIESLVARLAHDHSGLLQTQEAAVEELLRQERQWLDSKAAVEAADEKLTQSQHLLDQESAQLQQLQSRHAELSAAAAATGAALAELREERSAVQARHAVLRDLAQRFHSETGLKNVDQWARQGLHPWDSVIGCVCDLLEVTLEHAPIIEAALMGRSNLVVVRSLQPFLKLLESGELRCNERLGFIELGGQHAVPAPLELQNVPGVVERADRLVFEDPRATGLAAQVLGDTWLVESLAVARTLRGAGHAAARLVTLQGELLEANGTLHAGETPMEVSSIGTRTELRELRNRLARIDRDIVDCENHSVRLAGEIDRLNGAVALQQDVVAQSQSHFTRERTAHSLLQQEHHRLQSQLERQRRDAHSLDLRREDLQRQRQAAADRRETALLAIHQLRRDIEETTSRISDTETAISQLRNELAAHETELAKYEERLSALAASQSRLEADCSQQSLQVDAALRQIGELRTLRGQCTLSILQSEAAAAEHLTEVERLDGEIASVESQRREIRGRRNELSRREEQLQHSRREVGELIQAELLKTRDCEAQIEALAARIDEEYQLSLDDLLAEGCSALHHVPSDCDEDADPLAAGDTVESPTSPGVAALHDSDVEWLDDASDTAFSSRLFEQRREELDAQVQRLRRKIKLMGHVNTEALASLEDLETRHSTLASQLEDLQEAKRALEDIIRRINAESERLFVETFETIRGHFRELFRKLFGGGEADIILEDPNDILECGIDIVARPPGKELRSISLLSGGEKTLTAVGMLFAMFKSKPSPYCILDEVDAALDDANVERYATIVKEFRAMTQFVIITHRKRTMTAADVLYGVTMEQAGVSKRMSVKFEDVSENGDFQQTKAA
jgi:chromosome segregation protein